MTPMKATAARNAGTTAGGHTRDRPISETTSPANGTPAAA